MDVLNMRKSISFFLLILAALALGACTRSVSTSPVAEETEDPIESIFSTVATQTALAARDGIGGGEGVGTDDPDAIPATSTAAPTSNASPTPEATATRTPAPTPELSVPASYTLHQGEHPYCLARRFNIDPDALLSANGLNESNATSLSVGTTITIPSGAGTFGGARALRSHPATYTASSTDTWYSIACAFGDVWPESIAATNGYTLDDELTSGQQVHIP
jgi:LysM repeat protein